ncbi:MAG: arginine--tRNA ligase [Eubacteriales bacterium]
MNIIDLKNTLADYLLEKLSAISDSHGLSGAELRDMLEYPPNPELGELAFPCFKLSRALHKAPPAIASALSDGFSLSCIKKVQTAGAYLNFFIADSFYTDGVLGEIAERGDRYGSCDIGNGKTVVLDYSSPNVAKPFHIGHLGSTAIGHSIRLLHSFAGYKCVAINHLGDWGTQFGKLIVAYRLWGTKQAVEENGLDELVALYVRFHKEAENDKSLEDKARAEFTKLEHHDPENTALWKWLISFSLIEYKKTYKQLGIEFDSYAGESFYSDKMEEQVQLLRDKNLLKLDNGASLVDLEKYKMPPCLILKSDGSTLYPARDIAAAVYRKRTYNFDKCIIVTSAAQSLHFAQWFKVVELMGYDWYGQLVHIPYGTVSINGAKLATRTGNVVLLKDLFAQAIEKVREIIETKSPDLENKDDTAEAVGVGAIVFHYLYNSRIKDIDFVMEDALSFDGATGPYAQYTHARACSIIARSGMSDTDIASWHGEHELCEEERALIRTLSLFNEKVLEAIDSYEPCVITRYIIDIATGFNRFYHECQILGADDENTKRFRLKLTLASRIALKNALALICLRAPEKI